MKKVLLILMCCMAIQSVHAQDTPKWADKAKKVSMPKKELCATLPAKMLPLTVTSH